MDNLKKLLNINLEIEGLLRLLQTRNSIEAIDLIKEKSLIFSDLFAQTFDINANDNVAANNTPFVNTPVADVTNADNLDENIPTENIADDDMADDDVSDENVSDEIAPAIDDTPDNHLDYERDNDTRWHASKANVPDNVIYIEADATGGRFIPASDNNNSEEITRPITYDVYDSHIRNNETSENIASTAQDEAEYNDPAPDFSIDIEISKSVEEPMDTLVGEADNEYDDPDRDDEPITVPPQLFPQSKLEFAETTFREEPEVAPSTSENINNASAPAVSLNEKIGRDSANVLSKAFTLNDKFRFIREVFNDDKAKFDTAIECISSLSSSSQAFEYLQDLDLDFADENVNDFISIILNHFNS